MRESIEARLKEVEDKETDFQLFQAEVFKDLELKKVELSLIRADVIVRQEKLIEGLFGKIEMERKQFETTRKQIDEMFVDIYLKEKQVNLIKIQNDSRATELNKREQNLERCTKEIELREVVLASRKEKLIAKENLLNAREKILDLKKELDLKKVELDSVKKSEGHCSSKLDSPNPTPSADQRKKARKRLLDLAEESLEISDTDCNSPSKRSCHVKRSSNGVSAGGNSAHSNSDSASGNTSGSDDMDENHGGPLPSSRAPVNNAEHILVNEVSESDPYSKDDSVSNAIDCSKALINDFGKRRSKGCFSHGQIWACYDSGSKCRMPRLYVRIVKALGDNDYSFRLRTTLLLPPKNPYWLDLWEYENREPWKKAGLPVGCGNFVPAVTRIKYPSEFSHQMCNRNYYSKNCSIYPMKGEIWALYKDSTIVTLASNQVNHKNCKYEIVEVLSEVKSYWSTSVAYLDKIVGFVSLFQRRSQNEDDSFVINRSEFFRFSHKVPSFKMTGNNRIQGVPEGSFEKALPDDL
ncbi:hypothetical protein ACH5RR_033307 [Cinchona calisaya]|uniref:DUF3444 domain-containing protein n=1 Tax=Cinchona calisaya TaxID=153742 RepID=A0ABD2YPN0_9GENT